ncbi:MAG: hypothetical protein KIS65_04815 [Nitrosomonas sp.]|nr:hypothetical protein [Nitrosomonas sp.]
MISRDTSRAIPGLPVELLLPALIGEAMQIVDKSIKNAANGIIFLSRVIIA